MNASPHYLNGTHPLILTESVRNEVAIPAARTKALRIAIANGRGFRESIECISVDKTENYRSFAEGEIPVYFDKEKKLQLVKVRGKDLPWLLLHGHIDIAIGSSIWFEENEYPSLTLSAELPLMKCRLSVIAAKKMALKDIRTICSRFSFISKKYIRENDLDVKFLYMEGCHEVALTLGMSDAIIDIIETGNTIKRMNLTELDTLLTVTHGIWSRKEDSLSLQMLNECLVTTPY